MNLYKKSHKSIHLENKKYFHIIVISENIYGKELLPYELSFAGNAFILTPFFIEILFFE